MQTATKVPTKRRTTKGPVSQTVLRQWATDVRSGKYTMRSTEKHGFHYLTVVDGKDQWDIFGLLLDRVADEWILDRPSNVHTNTFYYKARIAGAPVLMTTILSTKVLNKLSDLCYAGAKPAQLADAIMSMKELIVT